LAIYEETVKSENLGAALQVFASQYGVNNKIDRNAPLEQQTLAAFHSLNSALSTYDPIAPQGQRISQTMGLATTVAGMFLGSTVGLAAGSTALALNMRSILFPNTEFRSSFAPSPTTANVTLCGRRDPAHGRTRLAYLWALRLPAVGPPSPTIAEPNNIAVGVKTLLPLEIGESEAKLVSRAKDWALVAEDGKRTPIPVAVPGPKQLELDLSRANVEPGKYRLAARWDWDEFTANGDIHVRPLAKFEKVRLTPASQNRLREHSGKQVVTVEGDDFEFVRKVSLVRKGDRYTPPTDLPFSLPAGHRRGPQGSIEMQVDTSGLNSGEYTLLLLQDDGKPRNAEVRVLPAPPAIEGLPLRVNAGDAEQTVVVRGKDLDRITGLEADGVRLDLEAGTPTSRTLRVRSDSGIQSGTAIDVRMSVKDYAEPVVLPDAIRVAAPRPRIAEVRVAPPAALGITVTPGELPAGIQTSAFLRVEPASQAATVHLACANFDSRTVTVPAGGEREGVRVNAVDAGGLFVSFDPALWPTGCVLQTSVEQPASGRSDGKDLGRVLRIPQIDSFQLTDEGAGNGSYYGVLTGRGLELIEKTGWDEQQGNAVAALPVPVAGQQPDRQSLRITMPWPSPAPHAPLFIWIRGEEKARGTNVRY
jgi:hypothetical protein